VPSTLVLGQLGRVQREPPMPMNADEIPGLTAETAAMTTERPLHRITLLVETEDEAEIDALVRAMARLICPTTWPSTRTTDAPGGGSSLPHFSRMMKRTSGGTTSTGDPSPGRRAIRVPERSANDATLAVSLTWAVGR
jgi:hypothetical protein